MTSVPLRSPRAADTAPFQSTLRMRILLFTAAVLILLLLFISQVLLHQWRRVIIAKQIDAAVAVSRTFATTVLDALIREEHSGAAREGVLQTSIDDFRQSLGNVKYVVILDRAQTPLAIGPALAADALPPHTLTATRANGIATRIFEDERLSWIIEVNMPLHIARKSWGTATIGFDATAIRDEIQKLFLLLFGTTMLVSLATLVVLYFLARRLTVSLTRLVNAMDSIDVDPGPPMPAAGTGDDVAFLFERFDRMKTRIEQSRLQLEHVQRQVYHAEKLASIGRIASGIAHQVNNPLNGIRSCLYAIEKEPGNAAQTREYVDLIGEAITSIEAVVQKLLGFVRQPSPTESLTDIALSTRKVVDLFNVRLREKRVRVALNLPEGLPLVAIDHQLFKEVVMNLLVNSYDAVGQEGSIVIAAGARDDGALFLSVRDDGVGIAPENIDRIFEPFFTTKESGKGTGLGLSVCQSIIETHGGRMTVESAPGAGACFTVILPGGSADERPHY